MFEFLNNIGIGSGNLNDNINAMLGVSIVLILGIYFYVIWNIRNEWYREIRGYWYVDPDFAKISSLSSGGLAIDKYFALEMDNGKGGVAAMLDDGDFSLSVDWWLIPGFGGKKYYSMKVCSEDIDKLGNFFDSDEMRRNIHIEIEGDTLYLYCHDTLYLKAIKHRELSDMLINSCQPDID